MPFCRWSLLLASLPVLVAPVFDIARKPNIVVITLDTTRSDRMGFLGSKRGLTPNLDALAGKSVVFTRAYAQAPLTTSSHATIFTGTYPQFHKVDYPGVPLAGDLPYAPAIVRKAGYRTAAFLGSIILDAKTGEAPGFDRGFDVYDAGFHLRQPGEDRYASVDRRAEQVVAHALAWIKKHERAAPFFVWIHLFDPHAPYEPPEPFATRFKSDPYDGEIAYTDSVIGTFFDQLRAARLYDDSVIAVMADHGEALGEHGERGHGVFLYDPTIRVPLLFKMPAPGAAGKRVDSRVELVDVLPTILQAVGIAVPKRVQGRSLLAMSQDTSVAARASKPEDRTAYSETDYPRRAFGWSVLRSLRSGKYLFVQAPRPELYDETADPTDDHDLAPTASAVAGTLSGQLTEFRRRTRGSGPGPAVNPDPQQQAKLQALGYTASTHQGGETRSQDADPKDTVELSNLMTDVNFAMEEGQYEQAIATLQGIIAKDPRLAPAYSALGSAWMHRGNVQNAIPPLRKAAELNPDFATAHYELGMALEKVGDLKGATPELEIAVAGSPASAEMRFLLASVYARADRVEEAKTLLQKARELRPHYYEANLLLGFIFVMQRDPASALVYLQEAIDAHPNSSKAHRYMAEAYAQMGDSETANRERSLAQQLQLQGR